MDTANNILPYLKFKLEVDHPDLDTCWSEGYKAAEQDIEQEANPYAEDSLEAWHWEQGWWAGFYEEGPTPVNLSQIESEGEMTLVLSDVAANESHWSSANIRRWTKTVVKVAGVVAMTVAAIEFLDLAS